MDRARRQVLPCPGLPSEENRDVHTGGFPNDLAHLTHLGAAPERHLFAYDGRRLILAGLPDGDPWPRDRLADGRLKLFLGERSANETV